MKAKTTRKSAPQKWRESFTVWIDFIGDRSGIGALLDHIAGCESDGGGTFLTSPPLSDQSWTSYPGKPRGLSIAEAREDAEVIFTRLQKACRARWSPYIRLRLLHDDKPERSPWLVLRKYQRGKCPDLSKLMRRKKRAPGARVTPAATART